MKKIETEEIKGTEVVEFVPAEETPDNPDSGEQKKGKDLKVLGMNIHIEKGEKKQKKEKKQKTEKKPKEHKVSAKKVAVAVGTGLAATAAVVGTVVAVASHHADQNDDDFVTEDETYFLDAPDDYPTETEETEVSVPVVETEEI